jgi:uncharacterized protein (TIGR00730 family)
MTQLRSICVFCGSSVGDRPSFAGLARALGNAMGEAGLRLVYGAGNVGLMGVLADTLLAAGGSAIGVIPRFFIAEGVAHEQLSELRVVETMHERKAQMMKLADAFIVLPGGIGTLEEFFEVWTWVQLGLMQKPVGLLNTDGFFDPLLTFLDQLVERRFMKEAHRELLLVDETPRNLLARLSRAEPTVEEKSFTHNQGN